MKTNTLQIIFLISLVSISLFTQAHDMKEHMKNLEEPKCETVQSMKKDLQNMDDPVMQAIMKQCMNDATHDVHNNNSDHENISEHHHTDRLNNHSHSGRHH